LEDTYMENFIAFVTSPGFILLVVLIAGITAMILSKKHDKKKKLAIFNSIAIGDDVVMINGMEGKVASVHDDTLEVEFGNGNRIRFKKWSIKTLNGKDIPR